MKFDNSVVVITSAARGLGQEYARQFARRGARVVVSDLRDCNETLGLIASEGAKCLAVTADVTDAASTAKMADAAIDKFGGIDALVNNAAPYGSLTFAPFDKLDEVEWERR